MDRPGALSLMSEQAKKNGTLMRSATIASLAVAFTLVVLKFAVGIYTNSVAILSSLVDSGLDLVASLINFYAVRTALEPADRQHRFGHGKAEAVAGLAQAAIISGSAAFVLFQAVDRLIYDAPVQRSEAGIAVMVVSIILTMLLVLYQRFVAKRTGSVAIAADSVHYLSDLLSNAAVIAALVLAGMLGYGWADPVFAILIALYIAWSAWSIWRRSMDMLMDRELPEAERAKIKEIVLRHKDVCDMHDLRTRSSGRTAFIQFHIDLATDISLQQAHEISDAIEEDLLNAFDEAEIIIHADPLGVEEHRAEFS